MILRTYMLSVTLLAAMIVAGFAPTADAGQRGRLYENLDRGFVVAHSRHGNGSVRGAVRPSRFGYQVRLPGGNWENCRRSCSETLRVETVDIWEWRQQGHVGLTQECGIFGCLDIGAGY